MRNWIEAIKEVSSATLTVRGQKLDPTDSGKLRWMLFSPRVNTTSTKLSDVLQINNRYVADRRPWNGKEREIPVDLPSFRDVSFTPIGAKQTISEEEIQNLTDNAMGNQEIVKNQLAISIPSRSDALVMACYRRLELDFVSAWTQGKVRQKDPQTSKYYDASFNFDAGRLTVAGTAWNVVANAYNEFVAWCKDAQTAIGSLAGVVTRRAVVDAILADAPTNAISGFKMTLAELTQRITQEIGGQFTIAIWEDSVRAFVDGGIATTNVNVFPAGMMMAVPTGNELSKTAFAPVMRAREIAAQVPEAKVDINGVTVYYVSENDGKTLVLQAQLNAFPLPDEQYVYGIQTGVGV